MLEKLKQIKKHQISTHSYVLKEHVAENNHSVKERLHMALLNILKLEESAACEEVRNLLTVIWLYENFILHSCIGGPQTLQTGILPSVV